MSHLSSASPVLWPILATLAIGCGGSEQTANPGNDAGLADSTIAQRDSTTTAPDQQVAQPSGLPVLGNGIHSEDAVQLRVVGSRSDGLNGPRDLAFHPAQKNQLWVVNQLDESVVIYGDATAPDNPNALSAHRKGAGGEHFLAQPASIAFGAIGYNKKYNFATAQETDKKTQGPNGTPADFMGPTMWTSDLSIFDAGHSSHLDMLHNSPNGVGIAWERDNIYWYFDGAHGSLTRYDFKGDHGPGGADHADGIISRYAEGQVKRVAGIPSHMVFDARSNTLYLADTGNQRIAAFDPSGAQATAMTYPQYDGLGERQHKMSGGKLTTLVDGKNSETELKKPSGLALAGDTLFVVDNETSTISAYDLSGKRLDWLKLNRPAGSLMGIEVHQSGDLYLVDYLANELLQIKAKSNPATTN